MAGDQNVVGADRSPVSLQRRANVGGVMSRGDIVGQDLEARGKILDLAAIGVGARRFGGAL
jgi:hypothetical protein